MGKVSPQTYLGTKELVKFGPKAAFLLRTRRSTLVLGGEYNRTLVSTLLAQLALC
jgi:hypothetical protein